MAPPVSERRVSCCPHQGTQSYKWPLLASVHSGASKGPDDELSLADVGWHSRLSPVFAQTLIRACGGGCRDRVMSLSSDGFLLGLVTAGRTKQAHWCDLSTACM